MNFKFLPVLALLLMMAACGGESPSGSSDLLSETSSSSEPFSSSSEISSSSEPSNTSSENSSSSEKPEFQVLLENDTIKSILGSDHFKVVFRDDDEETIRMIEYNAGNLKHKVLVQGMDVYHPTFSPDGRKVAFSSAFEGAPFDSRLYVLDLDNAKKIDSLDVRSAAIPRWYVTSEGDTVIMYVDYTGSDQDEAWLSSATWQVVYKGGKFGKPKKVVDRSYNGGIAFDGSFVATGAPRLYFHRLADDKDVVEDRYGDEQVCNVSISRDSSKLISFLETAGKMGKEFTHDKTGIWHHFVFYQDETGKIVNAIETTGTDTDVFDHVEWLDGIPVQIAIISSSKQAGYFHIGLIDYAKSKVHLLVESNNIFMWHPDLWFEH